MTTIIRIKRQLWEETPETIVVASKRTKLNPSSCDKLETSSAVFTHIGTVKADEQIEHSLAKIFDEKSKLSSTFRQHYKKRIKPRVKESCVSTVKAASSVSRYKLINLRRKISLDDGQELGESPTKPAVQVYDALQEDSLSSYEEDVITCNGVAMMTEKVDYVYDMYYTESSTNMSWIEDICEIQRYSPSSLVDEMEGSSDSAVEDEDDENEESNWRNDYPEERDDGDEEEEDDGDEDECYRHDIDVGLLSRKFGKVQIDSDESYDLDDYDENGDFDENGDLLTTAHYVPCSQLATFTSRSLNKKDDSTSSSDDENIY